MLRLARQSLWNRIMTQVKHNSGGRQAAITRKMQRFSLIKIGLGLVLCSSFVALLLRNDPFPGVRRNAMRQQQRNQVEEQSNNNNQGGGRDFRQPPNGSVAGGGDGDATQNGVVTAAAAGGGDNNSGGLDVGEVEEGGRIITFELSSLKNGQSGRIVLKTKPSWAPLGVEHFHELVDDHFYDLAKFFRVVNNFVVQFGIPANPKNKRLTPLKDDPVVTSNVYGTLTYATAGPNTRTTQIFINTSKRGNKFLDKQGFAPFAEIISGMEFVEQIDDEYGEKPNQGNIQAQGNAYLDKKFPNLSYISTAYDGPPKDDNEGGDENLN